MSYEQLKSEFFPGMTDREIAKHIAQCNASCAIDNGDRIDHPIASFRRNTVDTLKEYGLTEPELTRFALKQYNAHTKLYRAKLRASDAIDALRRARQNAEKAEASALAAKQAYKLALAEIGL